MNLPIFGVLNGILLLQYNDAENSTDSITSTLIYVSSGSNFWVKDQICADPAHLVNNLKEV